MKIILLIISSFLGFAVTPQPTTNARCYCCLSNPCTKTPPPTGK